MHRTITSLSVGQEYIIEINDCAMGLMGDGQDEDRKIIAEVVIKEMEVEQLNYWDLVDY